MLNTSSKQRLRLAHQLLDKELLSSSGVKASSVKETDVSKSRNVQSEIGELEKKLMDLEKKMENIEIPSSNDEEDNGVIQVNISKNNKTKTDKNQLPKQNTKFPSKNLKQSNHRVVGSSNSSAEQESQNDNQLTTKMKLIRQSKEKALRIGNNDPQKQKVNQKLKQIVRKEYAEEKELDSQLSAPKKNIKKNVFPQNISSESNIKDEGNQKNRSVLRRSVKSVKSNTSKKSQHSNASKNSRQKMEHSRIGFGSLERGGLTNDQLRQLHKQNEKQLKKISNLQKQLNHYKRLCQKQQQKIEQYRIMQIQFRKLQNNFTKSEQIRKQQKKIIENLKPRN